MTWRRKALALVTLAVAPLAACGTPCEKLANQLCETVKPEVCAKVRARVQSADEDAQRQCKATLDRGPENLVEAQRDVVATQLISIEEALDTSYIRHREMPANLDALVAEGYLKASKRLDPWGQPFSYNLKSKREYQLCSSGPDQQAGTADDICNH